MAASAPSAAEAAASAPPAEADARLPVTVLSGFLGAGKTTLLKRILKGDHGYRVAVIVNDMAELNVDAAVAGEVVESKEQLVSMQNGCICCTLREDLLVEVARLAEEGTFDYLVIESTGVSEPLPVAETFTFETGESPLSSIARLDTMVTVVDAANFGADLDSMDYLEDRDWAPKEEDDRNVSQLLVEQIEFADVVLVNKCDLVDEATLTRIEGVVRRLNPAGRVVRSTRADVPLAEVLNTGRFSLEAAERAPGWLKELRGEHVPETEEYGVSSFVFRAQRPFHPQRLDALMDSRLFSAGAIAASKSAAGAGAEPAGAGSSAAASGGASASSLPEAAASAARGEHGHVVRSKGVVWIAGEVGRRFRGDWSHAGRLVGLEPSGRWWAEVPREEWPAGFTPYRWSDDETVGDRQSEVVVIGMGLDAERVAAAMEACLVTDEEFAAGPDAWASFEDPVWGDVDADEHAAALDEEREHGHGDGHDGHDHDEDGACVTADEPSE